MSIFQFEALRVPNHMACRFAEKTRSFRSLWAGRRCAAASHVALFKGRMLMIAPPSTVCSVGIAGGCER